MLFFLPCVRLRLRLYFIRQVLSVLLERGADPSIKTKWKETAEDLARTNKQYGSLKVLQEHREPPVKSPPLVHTITESVW